MSVLHVSLSHPKYYGIKKNVQEMIDKSIEESKRKVKKSEETTSKQQILILHYLGFIQQINIENTKKALLFSKLLNRHEQNIREYLSYVEIMKIEISDIKTKSNLEAVRIIFEQSEMIDEIALIDKDLEKLDKIK